MASPIAPLRIPIEVMPTWTVDRNLVGSDARASARAAPVRLGIALPADKRLRALCQAVLDDPQRHATLAGWAREAGASERTVARLFRDELGTSFGPWRQQVLLGRALTLATQGKPMGLIAAELGYASASAFSAISTSRNRTSVSMRQATHTDRRCGKR